MSTPSQPHRQLGPDQATPSDQKDPHRGHRLLRIIGSALVPGSVAAIVSSIVITIFSVFDAKAWAAGTNAASQWVWGEQAHMHDELSVRYTLLGYVIHHGSSLFWACGYQWIGSRTDEPMRSLLKAMAITSLAYVVDYHVVPTRLSPGFDRHISSTGMFAVYSAFALGLWGPAVVRYLNEKHLGFRDDPWIRRD
jgi:hypothetical protein